ncbi:hypothetical protein V8F33_012627 [Rhypophila sp. PSN 637]
MLTLAANPTCPPIPDPASVTKPTLLHLQHSSSQIILWLLEELKVDYEVIIFPRLEGPAPPELKATHPQGKSPQLLLPGGRVLTQVSAITMYLLRTYDKDYTFHDSFPPSSTAHFTDKDPNWISIKEEQLVCIGISDIATKVGMALLWHGISLKSPFFMRPIFNTTRKYLHKLFLDADISAAFETLEMELGEGEWFLGRKQPGRVDFVVHYFVDIAVRPGYVKFTGENGEERYPKLKAWMSRCEAREAWKRSLEKGGGYDLDFPKRWGA